MTSCINHLYEFGCFRFDCENRTLWCDVKLIPLPPKATDVLFLLLEAEGKLVTKKEILNSVWADTFVEEGVLTQSIYQLRQALGTKDTETQFVENIARRGYRLAVPVRKAAFSESPATISNQRNEYISDIYTPEIKAESVTESNVSAETSTQIKTLFWVETTNPKAEKNVEVTKISKSVNKLLFLGIFSILIFTTTGFVVYQLIFKDKTFNQNKFAPIEQIKLDRLTDYGNVIYPTISPGGEMMAFVRHEDSTESVWIKQIETNGLIMILPPSKSGYKSPVFSPDGKYLYYRVAADGSGIFQVSVLGGTPKKIAENVWSDFGLSNDGKQFAFYRRDSVKNAFVLILSNSDGNGERDLRSRQSPQDYRANVSWSPDISKLAVVGGLQRQNFPKLYTVDTLTGEENEIKIPRWRSISHTLWMDGEHLLVSARDENEPGSQIWLLNVNTGEIRRLTNDLESYFWLSLSADGKRLIARQQRIVSYIWILPDGDLEKMRQLTTGVRNFDGYGGLAWTPDEKIIYTVRNGNTTDIFSMSKDGAEQVQLTKNAGHDNTNPVVTNDGKFIIYTSSRNGSQQIWRMKTNGQNQTQLTFGEDEKEIAHSADISPDSKDVYFIKNGKNGASIRKVPVEGGNEVKVFEQIQDQIPYFLAISPDGKQIAYQQTSGKAENSGDEPTMKIGIVSTQVNARKLSFDLPMRRVLIQWSGENTLDYFAGTFNSSSLMRLSISNETSKKLLDFPDRVHNFAWSKNGKYLVVSRGKLQGDAISITNLPR